MRVSAFFQNDQMIRHAREAARIHEFNWIICSLAVLNDMLIKLHGTKHNTLTNATSNEQATSGTPINRSMIRWLMSAASSRVIVRMPRLSVTSKLASGQTAATANQFELVARADNPTSGISSNPFLEYAFKTIEYRIQVSYLADGTWSYSQDTIMMIKGSAEPFHHKDNNLLMKVGEPTPNPLALEAIKKPS